MEGHGMRVCQRQTRAGWILISELLCAAAQSACGEVSWSWSWRRGKRGMKVSQLERLYRDSKERLREQIKKQEKERLDQTRKRIQEEQKALYEKKLQDVEERWKKEVGDAKRARQRELRLIQEEIERISEQAVSLKEQIDEMLGEAEDGKK